MVMTEQELRRERTVRVEAWNENQTAITLTVGQVLTIDNEGVVRNEYGSGLIVLRPREARTSPAHDAPADSGKTRDVQGES